VLLRLSRLWMTDGCVGEPYRALVGVWAVPDATSAGYLVLPLVERLLPDLAGPQPVPKRMLAAVMTKRIGS
jgi:hypothetical protein